MLGEPGLYVGGQHPLRAIPNEMQEKVKIIAKKEKRKISQQYELIVKEYLNNYEKTHGEIATGKSPGGGRRIMEINEFTFYSISLANFAAPRPRPTSVGAPAFPLWLANAA